MHPPADICLLLGLHVDVAPGVGHREDGEDGQRLALLHAFEGLPHELDAQLLEKSNSVWRGGGGLEAWAKKNTPIAPGGAKRLDGVWGLAGWAKKTPLGPPVERFPHQAQRRGLQGLGGAGEFGIWDSPKKGGFLRAPAAEITALHDFHVALMLPTWSL